MKQHAAWVSVASIGAVVACMFAIACGDDPAQNTSSSGGSSSGSSGEDASSSSSGGDASKDMGQSSTSSGTDSGNDTGQSGSGASCTANGAGAKSITANHPNTPHTLTIPAADFVNPADKTYKLSAGGGSGHQHDVPLTAAQLTTISAGQTVTITTTGNGSQNSHDVTIGCK